LPLIWPKPAVRVTGFAVGAVLFGSTSQPGSIWQAAEQQSPGRMLPSSQVSPPTMRLSPQIGAQTLGSALSHAKPAVSTQALQPSAALPLASSQVSAPFFTPSPQAGAWQMPPVHTPLAQSAAPPHTLPSAHLFAGAQEPPQSTSVSVPFFTVSLQAGTWQMPPVQTPLAQSPAPPQTLPSAHLFAGAQEPPQSTSVSVPFFTVSLQPAG
jgi:hypothetical protein